MIASDTLWPSILASATIFVGAAVRPSRHLEEEPSDSMRRVWRVSCERWFKEVLPNEEES